MAEATAEDQQTKSAENFEHVTRFLESSHASLEESLAGLSDEVCSYKPSAEEWSITEIVEHLVIIEKRVLVLLQTKLPEQELVKDASTEGKKDTDLVNLAGSRTPKIKAPEAVQPTRRYASCREALAAFRTARQRTLAYAASTPQYLRGRLLPHPIVGPIDGCQWLVVLAAHTERHVKQIKEIKTTL